MASARIAVTGTASFLGSRLLRRLAASRGKHEVLALDIAAPPRTLGVRHRELDLSAPAADQRLLDVFREQAVETVVHTAFFTNPRRDRSHSHELESIGTLGLLAAAAAAGVRHVVVRSFTAVYGARGQNPNFLVEDQPLRADPALGWARDKVEAEEHAAAFARRYPQLRVTVLRFAPLFGPFVRTIYTAIFDRRVVPVPMGYDPLVQLLHPDDALAALEAAVARSPGGVFNVVPAAPIPLLSALHLAGKIPLPVPHPLAHTVADALWSAGLGPAPGAFVEYARFLFVADGERAERALGLRPRYRSREALDAYLEYRHPRRATRAAEARA
jgi:UDP-glucose 4-epimerase